jgi:hypothetical protein
MSRDRKPLQDKVHPIWRGIGCLMMLLIPLLAFGIGEILIAASFEASPSFAQTFDPENPRAISILYLQAGATAVLSFILYLVFSILGSILFSMFGGSANEEIASRIGSGKR